MKRQVVVAEWRRASESLSAAEVLMREGCHADAVSRAYYAIMHAAKAALFVHDVAATSHAGVKRMFGLHLVRPGRIEPLWSDHLVEGSDERLAADYDVFISYSEQETRRECERAREFLERMRGYLIANGLAERDLDRTVHHG